MARFNPWPTNAAPGVVRIADAEPDSGSSALQATPLLQAPCLDPNRFSKSKVVDEFEERAPTRFSLRLLPGTPFRAAHRAGYKIS